MPLIKIDLHVHIHGDNGNIATELQKLKQFMGQEFDALKAQLETTNTKLTEAGTTIGTAATGLKVDVDQLKQMISDLSNGATPAQIAELKVVADSMSTTTDGLVAAAEALKNLDAETTQDAPQS